MIKYLIYQKNPESHYIDIDLIIDNINSEKLQLQLSSWRPGRYELGNFAKNIKRVEAFNDNAVSLKYVKQNKDLWEIDTKNCSTIKVTYSYYAAELNAGSCFADSSQLYLNPIHCCMFVVGRTDEVHQLELNIPSDYKIVCSLKQEGTTLTAENYDELVDSPLIASANIQSDFYTVGDIKFYLHFNGECKPNFEKIKKDFIAFSKKQIEFWKDCPTKEYHFLFQILPFKFYHGVEHLKSTVIAIGPGYAINEGLTYEDILGVSCHELFHTWNIKTIRPAEMWPYDYTKENYSRSGYVYEGFTTYYGDKLLLTSKVFSIEQYFKTLEERISKHFHNFGRYNLSVADSSWDTWLDGYVPGAPYRKTSIYDEGCLIAFMLDVKILKATSNQKSLHDVCLLLYERFGKKQMGYQEQDILTLVNEVSGVDFSDFFNAYVYTASDFEIPLNDCLLYLGIQLIKEPSKFVCENKFGFKTIENGVFVKVVSVAPDSPAWQAGLFVGDEIVAINKTLLKNNFEGWLHYFSEDAEITITVNNNEQLKDLHLLVDKNDNNYFFKPILKLAEHESTNESFDAWMNL
jgi:predicted metalloprotease with PDZ domain